MLAGVGMGIAFVGGLVEVALCVEAVQISRFVVAAALPQETRCDKRAQTA